MVKPLLPGGTASTQLSASFSFRSSLQREISTKMVYFYINPFFDRRKAFSENNYHCYFCGKNNVYQGPVSQV